MAKHVITVQNRVEEAKEFIESFSTSSFFIFAGFSKPRANVPDLVQSEMDLVTEPFKNMLFGKKVSSTDVKHMVRNVPWEINTVYDEYDDDENLDSLDYFIVVNEGTYYHYWKCISNNRGANSTVAPSISDLNEDDIFYQTADDYVWKYMATVDENTYDQHATSLYAPIEANTSVALAARAGGIDHIVIDAVGEGYGNHLSGTFAASDIRVNGNTLTYGIGSNSSASFVNSYYNDCYVYIAAGTGSGQYKRITSSYSNANGRFIIVESEFSVPPVATSQFEINPQVRVSGLGMTINAAARAIINTTGNTVHYVEILSRGTGYRDAFAEVISSNVVDVTADAELRPVMSPYGGHGYDVIQELRASRVSVTCRFSNTESNTIPSTNKFQQVGLIKNPVFHDVTINFSNVSGTFLSSENVSSISTRILSTGNVVTDNAYLTMSNTSPVEDSDSLYLVSDTSQQFITVSNVVNSTIVEMSANSLLSGNVSIYLANVLSRAFVSDVVDANTMVVSNLVHSYVGSGDLLVGETSGAIGTVDTVVRQDVSKGFSTFIGMSKIVCTQISGSFQEDEQVFQGVALSNSYSNGYVHSANTDGGITTLYVTDRFGNFDNVVITSITGANSAAVANNITLYDSEVSHGSGTILHLENIQEVDRDPAQAEEINIILAF